MINDPVNRPQHYTSHESGVECIEITRRLPFSLGNAFKYVFRHRFKGKYKEDIEKAVWYLNDCIQNMEGSYPDYSQERSKIATVIGKGNQSEEGSFFRCLSSALTMMSAGRVDEAKEYLVLAKSALTRILALVTRVQFSLIHTHQQQPDQERMPGAEIRP